MSDPLTEPLKRSFARIMEAAPTAGGLPPVSSSTPPPRQTARVALRVGLAAGLVATTLVIVQATRGSEPRSVTDATVGSVASDVSAPTSSTPPPTPASSTQEIVLTGRDGGLYLDEAVLSDGLMLTGAREDQAGGGSSSEFGVWATTLALYSSDRSRMDRTIEIQTMQLPTDRSFRTVGCGDEGTPVDVNGTEVWLCERAASWGVGPWTILAFPAGTPSTTEELLQVVANAEVDEQGRVGFDVLPAGFEVVGTLPDRIEASGRRWTTGYVTPDATTYDEPVVTLTVVEQPERPAEFELAFDARASHTGYATAVLGRRAIVARGHTSGGLRPAVTVTWDESDGQQIQLRYVPLRRDEPWDVVAGTAVELARGVRRADNAGWQELIAVASTTMQTFVDDLERPTWMIDELADRNLELVSMRPIASSAPAVLLADVTDSSGADAGTCEFMLRQLVACTTPDDPIWNGSRTAVATRVDGGYLRIIATGDVTIVRLADPESSNPKQITALRGAADGTTTVSPGVAYFEAVPDGAPTCLELRTGTDTDPAIATFQLLGTELTTPGESCDKAVPYGK